MKLVKLAFVAAVALGSMGMAQAGTTSQALSAKLQTVSTQASTAGVNLPPLQDPNRKELREWFTTLSADKRKVLLNTYRDLPKSYRQYLVGIWKDLPVSAG